MVLEKILLVHSKLKLWTFFRGHGEYKWPLATSTCTLISCPVKCMHLTLQNDSI